METTKDGENLTEIKTIQLAVDSLIDKTEHLFWQKTAKENDCDDNQHLFSNRLIDFIKEPLKLFQFRRCSSNSFSGFINDEIFASKTTAFNDPYDNVPYVNQSVIEKSVSNFFTKENLEKIVNGDENRSHFLTRYADTTFTELIRNLDKKKIKQLSNDGVLSMDSFISDIANHFAGRIVAACFTPEIDNMLMWSHYADSHKGFALEYHHRFGGVTFQCDKRSECCKENTCICNIRFSPVVYRDKRYDASSNYEFLAAKFYWMKKLGKNGDYNKRLFEFDTLIKQAIVKLKEWEYENECRLFHTCVANDADQRKNYFKLPVVGIYYGEKIDPAHRNALGKIAKAKGIREYTMKHRIDYDNSKMEILPYGK